LLADVHAGKKFEDGLAVIELELGEKAIAA